jgi:hypothetical protein
MTGIGIIGRSLSQFLLAVSTKGKQETVAEAFYGIKIGGAGGKMFVGLAKTLHQFPICPQPPVA